MAKTLDTQESVTLSYDLSYIKLALLFYQNTQYPQAIQFLKKGLKIEPNNPSIHSELGKNYEALGDKKTAGEYFKKISFKKL